MRDAGLPLGYREYLPAEQERIDHLVTTISGVYERFGYRHLDAGIMHHVSFLPGTDEHYLDVYCIRNDKRDKTTAKQSITLRSDLIQPLIRYIQQHRFQLTFPLKRWDHGQVFERRSGHKNLARQQYECNFDIIGEHTLNPWYDREACQIVIKTLLSLGFTDFEIHINNHTLFAEIIEALNITDNSEFPASEARTIAENFALLLHTIPSEKIREYQETDDFMMFKWLLRVMVVGSEEAVNIEEIQEKLSDLIFSDGTKPMGILLEACGIDIQKSVGFREIQELLQGLTDEERSYVVFDFSIASNSRYHTGIVFETFLGGKHRGLGNIFSGGRYEKLIQKNKTYYPGVGGSLKIAKLLQYFEDSESIASIRPTGTVIFLNESLNNTALVAHITRLRHSNEEVNVVCGTSYQRALKIAIKNRAKQLLFTGDGDNIMTKLIDYGGATARSWQG